ncbi:MAG: glycogen/starch/alpha-glucan phosphorylase [Solobacterium sp.]|nr:glycogen/starch/alpha-glucan phosphorylase [Solobacterium sp.]
MFRNKNEFKKEFARRIVESYGTAPELSHPTEQYLVLGEIVRDYANVNWKDTKVAERRSQAKQVYYFSMEFLLGRMMTSNIQNLGIYDIVVEGLSELGLDYSEIAALEADPGLGNGGLGRLAACFMDSSASLNYPVNGNCIRYRAGLFRQIINKHGEQVEVPDMWLRLGNPWEVRKPKYSVDVKLYGQLEVSYDEKGDMHFKHVHATHILAVPYDMAMIGAGTKMANTLRLWSAEPADVAPRGVDYRKYLSDVDDICLNVYPDDSTEEGKYLRLKQQYFFVCAGINSIITDHRKKHDTLDSLGKYVAIQLNDTHPVLAIPELMRVLMDDNGYQWDKAWEITKEVMAYTNHTVMSEALEKWPLKYIQILLPRISMIIEEIDRRACAYIRQTVPEDPAMVDRIRIIRDDQVHMANLAIIGSHSVNGVARIHSDILKNDLFRDFYRVYPQRFSNKTNGITPRRWMLYSNPELRELISSKIGRGYESDYRQFEQLLKYADDPQVQQEFLAVKAKRKEILTAYIKERTGIEVNPESIFDTQAKRLHAYKRQLLNVMNIIYRYQRIKSDPNYKMYPHTYLFAAKAASSYVFAKKVIKLINCVARKINADPDVKDMIKVVFLPNYNVSMSEILVPGTDVSEQISTAGKEASGTGNMKFMMNGAVTIGTMDGANVEIDNLVGRDNDVIFGLNVDEINNMRYGYNARGYFDGDERIRKVLNSLIDGTWSDNRDDFRVIYDEILMKNDEFFLLPDFDSYLKAQDEIERRYLNRNSWARMCLVNIAKSGYFSSDRTIEEYATEIWGIDKLDI